MVGFLVFTKAAKPIKIVNTSVSAYFICDQMPSNEGHELEKCTHAREQNSGETKTAKIIKFTKCNNSTGKTNHTGQ